MYLDQIFVQIQKIKYKKILYNILQLFLRWFFIIEIISRSHQITKFK